MGLPTDLRHHAHGPLELDRSCTYPQSISYKPKGLWISVDDDWRRWVTDEEMDWLDGQPEYAVRLRAEANVLHLSSADELDAFTDKFGMPYRAIHPSIELYTGDDKKEYIDWPTVAPLWAGIIIAPYLWERRMGPMWYYGWDCASGCIWDLSAVAELTPLA